MVQPDITGVWNSDSPCFKLSICASRRSKVCKDSLLAVLSRSTLWKPASKRLSRCTSSKQSATAGLSGCRLLMASLTSSVRLAGAAMRLHSLHNPLHGCVGSPVSFWRCLLGPLNPPGQHVRFETLITHAMQRNHVVSLPHLTCGLAWGLGYRKVSNRL